MSRKSKPSAAVQVSARSETSAYWEMGRLLALIAIPTVIYAQTIHFPFINFDDPYIATNEHLPAGLTWENICWAFTSFDYILYQPLMWLSHMVEVELFGGSAGVFHTGNV